MVSNNAVEWDWPGKSTKTECKKQFPSTFLPNLWVSAQYCVANAARITDSVNETDPFTLQSKRLMKARKDYSALAGVDNESTISVIQKVWYSDMSETALARGFYVDAPPEPISVAAECDKLAPGAIAKRP